MRWFDLSWSALPPPTDDEIAMFSRWFFDCGPRPPTAWERSPPLTLDDLRAALDEAGTAGPRRVVEVTQEEVDAYRRGYGLSSDLVESGLASAFTDLWGVQIVVVGIEDVQRRQAELEELL